MVSGMINETAGIAVDIPVDRAGSAQPRTAWPLSKTKAPSPGTVL